jgi:hypothetical protein
LSKGVHELTDEECKVYFSSLKTALIIILDEELQRKRREEQRLLLSREIALIPLTSSANNGETEYSDRNGGGRDY